MKLLLFLFFPILGFCQTMYSGKVINNKTGESIPYAAIALSKANIGTNTDENGNFSLSISIHDTLIISCIGYEALKVSAGKLPKDSVFKLSPKTTALEGVIVRSSKGKKKEKLNKFSGTGWHSRSVGNNEMQIAQPFKSPVDNAQLLEVHIAKKHGRALFRLRIYGMDSLSRQPSIDLADTLIQISSEKSQVHLDLSGYKIYLPQGTFFVAVEWLKIPSNEFTESTRMQGKKTLYKWYSPEIFVSKEKIANDLDLPWNKNYNGKWKQDSFRHSFRISATIAY